MKYPLVLAACILIALLLQAATQKKQAAVDTGPPAAPDIYHVTVDPHAPLDCDNLPPVCPGGLLPYGASVDDMNSYTTQYDTAVCRYTAPPRCFTGQNPQCDQECTQ